MRTVPANFTAETAKQVTTPVYLVEMYFSGADATVRVSSRQQVTYDDGNGDHIFAQTNPHMKVTSVSSTQAALIVTAPTPLMLYNTLQTSVSSGESGVKILAMYGDADYVTNADVALIFDGVIDEIPVIKKTEIRYSCISGNLPTMWTPRILIGPPLCNHLPVDGTVIGNITLERK